MAGLFRPEALEHRQREWLGSIQLVRPVSLALLTGAVVVTVIAVALFLGFGEYTRKARVAGYLVPEQGLLRLMSPQPALVVESHVAEGRAVRRGDVLFVLAIGQSTLAGDTQVQVDASLAARRESLRDTTRQRDELQRAQLDALDRQISDLAQESSSIAAEADLQRQRLGLAQQAQVRLESLKADNFVSSAQVQTKVEEVLGLKAQLQALDRQRSAQMRSVASLQAQRRELPLRTSQARGEIDRDLSELVQKAAENEARRRIVIRAPQDGSITGIVAEAGQTVTPAAALASLLPAGSKLQAHLFAPSSAVGFLRADQPVQLRYQAFPYQKFGHQDGSVLQVARSPLQAAELASLPLQLGGNASNEPLYRITVRLDRQSVAAYGQPQALAPGMQIEADVLLDRRRLIEWLFEPVLSLTGAV